MLKDEDCLLRTILLEVGGQTLAEHEDFFTNTSEKEGLGRSPSFRHRETW